ncbi:hypothetical protein DFJ73DRAFT_767906 [Zopfochytrium polystomum]|nr:hypothetical protein DFJ73DRAFT_767906 [Zopfochytrium polystomum]
MSTTSDCNAIVHHQYRGNGDSWEIICDSNGRVTYVDFPIASMQGGIPTQIFQLTELVELDLSQNYYTGTIPVGFGSLTKLRTLRLGYQQLYGSIPDDLASIRSNLAIFDISGTCIVGASSPPTNCAALSASLNPQATTSANNPPAGTSSAAGGPAASNPPGQTSGATAAPGGSGAANTGAGATSTGSSGTGIAAPPATGTSGSGGGSGGSIAIGTDAPTNGAQRAPTPGVEAPPTGAGLGAAAALAVALFVVGLIVYRRRRRQADAPVKSVPVNPSALSAQHDSIYATEKTSNLFPEEYPDRAIDAKERTWSGEPSASSSGSSAFNTSPERLNTLNHTSTIAHLPAYSEVAGYSVASPMPHAVPHSVDGGWGVSIIPSAVDVKGGLLAAPARTASMIERSGTGK